ncbi:lysylphosphatidylglycerol synthase transmembrane domain-containing protein [Bacteroidota bacterium]
MFNNSGIETSKDKKTPNYIWIITKVVIIIITYLYIAYELFNKQNLENFLNNFKTNFRPENYFVILIVFILLIGNIAIEALKWRFLIKKIEKISFYTSFRAVITGITLSIFTPNRIGEIASRIFILKRENRKAAIFSSAAGVMGSQLIVLFFGFISCLIFYFFFSPEEFLTGNKIFYYGIPAFIFCIIFTLIFLNLSKVSKVLIRFKFFKKYREAIHVLSLYDKKDLANVLFLSFIRYSIYTSQLALLLIFFNVDIKISILYLTIAIIYFFLTFIPSFTFAEIGIRGSVAIFIIGYFSNNTIGILSATTLIWIINLIIPAIIGSILLYKIKF